MASAAAAGRPREQAGGRRRDADDPDALAAANRAYRERFGHIFIVCATGRAPTRCWRSAASASPTTPTAELAIAAEEQRKITRLRLEKLLLGMTRGRSRASSLRDQPR